jgi:hypothetical protein
MKFRPRKPDRKEKNGPPDRIVARGHVGLRGAERRGMAVSAMFMVTGILISTETRAGRPCHARGMAVSAMFMVTGILIPTETRAGRPCHARGMAVSAMFW